MQSRLLRGVLDVAEVVVEGWGKVLGVVGVPIVPEARVKAVVMGVVKLEVTQLSPSPWMRRRMKMKENPPESILVPLQQALVSLELMAKTPTARANPTTQTQTHLIWPPQTSPLLQPVLPPEIILRVLR